MDKTKMDKLMNKNPIISSEVLNADYKLLSFEGGYLVLGVCDNLILVDKFGNGLASSEKIDFDNISDIVILSE